MGNASDYNPLLCDSCNRTPAQSGEEFYGDGAGHFLCQSCLADLNDEEEGSSYRLTWFTPGTTPGTVSRHEATFEDDTDDMAVGQAELVYLEPYNEETGEPIVGYVVESATLDNETTGETVARWEKGELVYDGPKEGAA